MAASKPSTRTGTGESMVMAMDMSEIQ
jgi:hypothetical protein